MGVGEGGVPGGGVLPTQTRVSSWLHTDRQTLRAPWEMGSRHTRCLRANRRESSEWPRAPPGLREGSTSPRLLFPETPDGLPSGPRPGPALAQPGLPAMGCGLGAGRARSPPTPRALGRRTGYMPPPPRTTAGRRCGGQPRPSSSGTAFLLLRWLLCFRAQPGPSPRAEGRAQGPRGVPLP